jgi:putative PIN family toxin of toxin-antitoxin system
MNVVLDTNVLISGLINIEGIPAQIVNLLINSRLTLLYDSRILKEYEEVLGRKKFGFTGSVVAPLLDYIKNEGEYIAAEPTSRPFRDKDDIMFYEVAKTAKAKYLVTGNKEHYPKERMIKSPKEFIELYLAEQQKHQSEPT